jgi:HTH-type transcriptional regulator, sugar sensing transcriptional regulator
MYQEILQGIGLSPNETKIYEALLDLGESSISEIAVKAKIHRRNTYDAIQRLIDKGLCFEILSHSKNNYSPVDPEKLRELLAERQKQLQEVLPALASKYREQKSTEEVYIYRGFEGLKNVWRLIVQVGKDSHFVGAKAQWFDPRLETSRKSFFAEANRKKIKFYLLFDHEVKTKLPGFAEKFPASSDYRFLPKEASTNSVIQIIGDYVLTYTGISLGKMDENTTFFIIKSKDLAESYRTWFWFMWKQSKK